MNQHPELDAIEVDIEPEAVIGWAPFPSVRRDIGEDKHKIYEYIFNAIF